MPQFLDWRQAQENIMRVETVDVNPISMDTSLRMESLTSEFVVGQDPFRKTGAVWMREDLYPIGFSDGKIRTLLRMDTIDSVNTADPTVGWGGIFFLTSAVGIGTFFDATNQMYQVSNRGGTIKVDKFDFTVPTTILDTGVSLTPGQVYGIEVYWEYNFANNCTKIRVYLGTDPNFLDLTMIGTFNDVLDSVNTPYQFSMSEGLFAQTATGTDFVSFTFDRTTVTRIVML